MVQVMEQNEQSFGGLGKPGNLQRWLRVGRGLPRTGGLPGNPWHEHGIGQENYSILVVSDVASMSVDSL